MVERTVGCSFSGCERDYYARGFCRLHYKRARAGLTQTPCIVCGADTPKAGAKFCGQPCQMRWHREFGCYRADRERVARGACTFDSCDKPIHANGFCRAHNMRLWRYGDAGEVRRAPRVAQCVKCGADRPRTGSSKDLCHRCYHNAYYHDNVETERPRRNARRSYLKKITPAWADLDKIRAIYAGCPEGHQVDHVIPIRGRRVSGLHVEGNLQYLTNTENKRKLNSFDSR